MIACTFFGHRDSPKELKPILRMIITELIEYEGIKTFYVGNQGSFDFMAHDVLRELKLCYPEINFYIVMAYPPKQSTALSLKYEIIVPEGIESVPKRYAILHRNKWMVENSGYVVTYVNRNSGGAAKFRDLAIKKNKKVIDLANFPFFEDWSFDLF